MSILLSIRENIKRFYSRFDVIVDPVVKLVLVFFSLLAINSNIGKMQALTDPFIMIIICLACVLLPYGFIDCILALVIIAHIYAADMFLAAALLAVLFMIGVVYCCFRPGHSWLLMVIPLLFAYKIPYIIPIIVGLTCPISAVVPVVFGTVIYFILNNTAAYAAALEAGGTKEIVDMLLAYSDILIKDRTMYVMAAAFAAAVAAAYFIRKLSVDYADIIAAGASALVMLTIVVIGAVVLHADISLPGAIVQILISAVLSAGLAFMILPLDYSRTEHTQFEDDYYYYYVKAVPKMRSGRNSYASASDRKGER